MLKFDPKVWPFYSKECRRDVDAMLRKGGTLSAYRSNKSWGPPPRRGSWCERFERELEKRFHVEHAIAVNSGTMALTASLIALDLPKGSEVITTPYSFSATVASILLAGYTPKFADIDRDTFCITPDTVKDVISRKTKAIVPVDLFGKLCEYDGFDEFELPIIRDGCQSVGARINGRYHFGLCTCASGNGGKNLPIGEGGFVLTDNDNLSDRIRKYISHAENFDEDWIGVNGRLPELSSCVAYHGLINLEKRNKQRIALVERLTGCPQGTDHVYYVYASTAFGMRTRSEFCKRVRAKGISIGEGYIIPPLHHYLAFKKYATKQLPVADNLSFYSLWLIDCLRPPATMKDADYVHNVILEAL